MLDTVVMSGDDVCCSVVFGTLVGVFVFSVIWSELLITSAISCPLCSSVYECLPWVVLCCLLLGPDCSYIPQGLVWTECKLFYLDLVRGCFVLSRQKLYVGMGVCISSLHSYLCVWMWLWCRLHRPWPEPVHWVVVSLRCKC